MKPTETRTVSFQNMHVLEKNKAHAINCLIFHSRDMDSVITTVQLNIKNLVFLLHDTRV